MATKSRSYDDMHPRRFPSEKKQLVPRKIQTHVPKPTLPGVSIILDKNQLAKAAPKKSFIKWKQQHEALFEPKSFRTTNQRAGFVQERKVIPYHTTAGSNAKFDEDYQKQQECQPFGYDNAKTNLLMAKNDQKPQFKSMMTFSQLNRVARSEATRSIVPLAGQYSSMTTDDHQPNLCGCKCVAVTASQVQDKELHNDQATHSNQQEPSMELAVKTKGLVTNEALANIVEEQIEIVEQQKQILKQQNEIFSLQYQIEKLLLINNDMKNVSPMKQLQSTPFYKSKTASLSASPNAAQIENNGTLQSTPKSRKSIGVMTSFHGNLDELCSPDRNHNCASSSENDSPKDTMLERINKIIKNSPPMMNYKLNNGTKNCLVSPVRTDINISSQTLIYKTSTRNNISINDDPITADRSFALHLLDMKYHPESQPPMTPNGNLLNPRHGTIAKANRTSPKYIDNDFVPTSNISPDKYDYLIRHGLLKK